MPCLQVDINKMIKKLKNIIPVVKENVSLKNYTSFKIGGPAKYLAIVNNEDTLIKLLKFAKEGSIKYLIIGKGSNLLVSDKGFDGLVIILKFDKLNFDGTKIEVSPDILLGKVIGSSVSQNLAGLEFATGIPGTVGGAVVGNAGAYGGEMADVIEKVEVLDENLDKKTLTKDELNFSYRNSIIKNSNTIVLNIFLELKKGNKQESLELMKKYAQDRFDKHPPDPSAGSTFKNVELTDEVIKTLESKKYDIPKQFYEYKKIPAAWLIDQIGLKGKQIGGAQISNKHANHLVNTGEAKADDVVQLISMVKTKIRDELGIQLEEEVRYIGF